MHAPPLAAPSPARAAHRPAHRPPAQRTAQQLPRAAEHCVHPSSRHPEPAGGAAAGAVAAVYCCYRCSPVQRSGSSSRHGHSGSRRAGRLEGGCAMAAVKQVEDSGRMQAVSFAVLVATYLTCARGVGRWCGLVAAALPPAPLPPSESRAVAAAAACCCASAAQFTHLDVLDSRPAWSPCVPLPPAARCTKAAAGPPYMRVPPTLPQAQLEPQPAEQMVAGRVRLSLPLPPHIM